MRATSADGRREIAETLTFTASPALRGLSLASPRAPVGAAWSSVIVGLGAGSSLSVSSDGGTPLVIAGGVISGVFPAAGMRLLTLVETLDGALSSPRTSVMPVTATAVAMLPDGLATDYAAV